MTSNQIAYAKVVEEALANRNREALTKESNRLQETSNAIAYMNAETSRYQADIKAREVQNNYLLQTARQAEEQRHNIESERLSQQRNDQDWYSHKQDLGRKDQEIKYKYTALQHEDERARKSNLTGILGKLVGPGIAAATAFLGI